MKLKRDAAGNVVVVDDKPVYLQDDGKEVPFDVVGTIQAIKDRNAEVVSWRTKAKESEEALAKFVDLDPAAARDALDKLSKIDQKKLIDAGQVDVVREEVRKNYETKLADETKKREAIETRFKGTQLAAAFSGSEWLAKNTKVPRDMLRSFFGNRFEVDLDGKIQGLDESGKPLFSISNPGAVAGFDEAIQLMIERYPAKNDILSSSQGSGGGSPSGGGGGGSGQMHREAWEKLTPAAKAAAIKTHEIID